MNVTSGGVAGYALGNLQRTKNMPPAYGLGRTESSPDTGFTA